MHADVITEETAREMVRGFWENVDGGYCFNCSGDAVDVCAKVFPDIEWRRLFDEVRAEYRRMTAGTLWGIPEIQTVAAPKDTVFVLENRQGVVLHPVVWLRCRYPLSPVWCERTAGHREMRRDQRRGA